MTSPNDATSFELKQPDPAPVLAMKRALIWAAAIYVCVNLVAFASGLSMAFWEVYGDSMQEAIENARWVRRAAYGATGALLYWRFAVGIKSHRLLNVLVAFLLVQAIDLAVSLLAFDMELVDFLEPGPLGRSLLAALAGWGLASIGASRSRRRLRRE